MSSFFHMTKLSVLALLLFLVLRVSGERDKNTSKNGLRGLLDWQMEIGQTASATKPKPIVQPYSGELARLRSKFLNLGFVEVYRSGQWGYICNDNWDITDASVVCKQLGFIRGASSATEENLNFPENWSTSNILMDDMECDGTETSLHQCEFNIQHDCTMSEAVSVKCHPNEGCPVGWVAGPSKCYKFYSRAKNINLAGDVCARENASLVTIESSEENNFLSNVIKNTLPNFHHWYTGGKRTKQGWQWNKFIIDKNARNKNLRKTSLNRKSLYKTMRSAVAFKKWFPGWPSSENMHMEPVTTQKHDCLTLSDAYNDPAGSGTNVVDYFFWKAEKCSQKDGISFICQLKMNDEKITVLPDCYTDTGKSYRGIASVTEKGSICQSWAESPQINEMTHPGQGLGDHNYCRNPDNDTRPWCWVSHENQRYGFCKISLCSALPPADANIATTTTTTPPVSGFNCPLKEFYCHRGKVCIPAEFRCDMENDCLYNEDEAGCVYTLGNFLKTGSSLLHIINHLEPYGKETYMQVSAELCAKKCIESSMFVCRSFIYSGFRKSCVLSSFNRIMDGTITPSLLYDYYELKPLYDCTGKFQCNDKTCINMTFQCNGKYDCKDRSDEQNCNDEVHVKLVGGEEHSGTVEISYQGKKGVICDDEWSIEDATVVCKMLGYRGAERATEMNFFDYSPVGAKFLLDDVRCFGNETSISSCTRKPWHDHDCRPYEIAGVKCRISKVCEVDQFKCKNKMCVNPMEICNKIDDCGDNSDELDCQINKIKLVNGSTSWEGRVEVERNGVWGTICDDHWNNNNAMVVCRALGFMYGGEAKMESFYGPGKGPIWLDNVQCTGKETLIDSCQHTGWAKHDCDHSEDAGVKCFQRFMKTTPALNKYPTAEVTTPSSTTKLYTNVVSLTTKVTGQIYVRLIGGRDQSEGNVEIIVNNMRYRVCDDYWDNKEARVVCRMLGFSAGGVATEMSFFGADNTNIIFDNVNCNGTENHISYCAAIVGVNKHDCSYNEFAGVKCIKNPIPKPTNRPGLTTINNAIGKCGIRPFDYLDLMNPVYPRNNLSNSSSVISTKPNKLFTKGSEDIRKINKIIGGRYAAQGEIPWQARIHLIFSINHDGSFTGVHFCGAVIISEFWLLSAAHCFIDRRKSQFRVIIADHSVRYTDRDEKAFEVQEIIMHELYDDDTKNNDIALIKIKPDSYGKGIQFNNYAQPVCLPDAQTPYIDGTKCLASGWGNIQPSPRAYPDILQAVELPLISRQKCETFYNRGHEKHLTDKMLCAGFIAGGIDSCDGDSGGPLVCKVGNTYTLYGIVSWGRGCAMPNLPGVYTNVVAFLSWIQNGINTRSDNGSQSVLPTKN